MNEEGAVESSIALGRRHNLSHRRHPASSTDCLTGSNRPVGMESRERVVGLRNAALMFIVAVPILGVFSELLRRVQLHHLPNLRYDGGAGHHPSMPLPLNCGHNASGKQVISMSLFGTADRSSFSGLLPTFRVLQALIVCWLPGGREDRYRVGVLRNAERMSTVYPKWTLRVYLNRSETPAALSARLQALGAEVIRMFQIFTGMPRACSCDGALRPWRATPHTKYPRHWAPWLNALDVDVRPLC